VVVHLSHLYTAAEKGAEEMSVAALKSAPKLFGYAVPPIDYWEGWTAEKEFLLSCLQNLDVGWGLMRLSEYAELRRDAMELAKRAGWEGDIREGPYVAAVPNGDCESSLMIAWKQSSNGDTFIVSPFLLPWLGEWLFRA
jgi:hypothetical protein